MEEIWKDIKGYEGKYQISNLGRVKSLNYNTKILKYNSDGHGYLKVILYKNNKRKSHRVHRLVAEAFIPNLEDKNQVNHINGNKQDNRAFNLEWCTAKENVQHSLNTGLSERFKGENNPLYGRTYSMETRIKMSKSHKGIIQGKNNPMYGKMGEKHPRSRKIICITTGDIFHSITQASEKYNINKFSISNCCRGKTKSAGKHPITKEKLVWKYLE